MPFRDLSQKPPAFYRAIFGINQPSNSYRLRVLAVFLLLSGLFLQAAYSPSPGQAAPGLPSPLRWGYYVRTQDSLESLQRNIQNLDAISPYYFVLGASGRVTGYDQPEVTNLARSRGVKVFPMLQNDTTRDEFHALITNGDQVKTIVDQIENLVVGSNYDGFHIDFEDLRSDDRPYLTRFMALLYARLKPRGKLVTMAVPAKYQETFTEFAGPYDYAALAPSLDLVTIMAYDYHYSGGPNGPVAPVTWVNACALYAASQFGANKVLLGVPFYGYDWNLSKGTNGIGRTYEGVMSRVQQYGGTLGFDENAQTPYADYTQDGDKHRVWFENARSMVAKMDVIRRYNLGGWAAWRLGQENFDFWKVISSVFNPTRPVLPVANTPARIYFKETGHTLGSIFMKYWQQKGGAAQFGYPWTEEMEEASAFDGKIYIVQYFERARFEYHPETPGNEVQLGLIGTQLAASRRNEAAFRPVKAPAPATTTLRVPTIFGTDLSVAAPVTSDVLYFKETSHTLSGGFRKYWEANGGLTTLGMPVSEEFEEQSSRDGKVYTVQYFERNRLEYHPENAGTKDVIQLGLLGNQLMQQRGWLSPQN